MPCCTYSEEWETNLSDLTTQHRIRVEYHHEYGCGKPFFKLFANDSRLPHELIHDGCSPICGFLGRCEWQMDGHRFMIVENSTLRGCFDKRLRLFIDGIDVDTGKEYNSFWRRRGWIYFGIGTVLFFLLLGGFSAIFFFDTLAMIRPAVMLVAVSIIFMVFGAIAVRKFKSPSPDQNVQFCDMSAQA